MVGRGAVQYMYYREPWDSEGPDGNLELDLLKQLLDREWGLSLI